MTSNGNICPNCNEKNDLEAVVCQQCGAALDDPFMDPGARTKRTNIPAVTLEDVKNWPIAENATVPDRGIAIYIEGEARPICREYGEEFVLGRQMDNESRVKDGLIDLSPLGGYSRGISRQHVVIRRTGQGYEILDLGSVNGTWVNGERLAPQKYYPLASGSHLRLGGMLLYVTYRAESQPKS